MQKIKAKPMIIQQLNNKDINKKNVHASKKVQNYIASGQNTNNSSNNKRSRQSSSRGRV